MVSVVCVDRSISRESTKHDRYSTITCTVVLHQTQTKAVRRVELPGQDGSGDGPDQGRIQTPINLSLMTWR